MDLSDPDTIVVLYSCPACALLDAPCRVLARQNESVVDWMDQTVLAIWRDHKTRSPACRVTRLHNLMIPAAGADRIGAVARH